MQIYVCVSPDVASRVMRAAAQEISGDPIHRIFVCLWPFREDKRLLVGKSLKVSALLLQSNTVLRLAAVNS